MALVIVLLVGAAITFNRWNEYQATDSDERQKLATQAQLVEAHISGLVRNINLALDQIIIDTIRSGRCDPKLLQRIAGLYPELRAFTVIDALGINRCASRKELVGLDRSVESYVQLSQQKPQDGVLIIEKPLVSKLSGVPILVFHKAKVDASGRLLMIAQVSIDLRYLDTLLETLRVPNQTVFLAHDSGLMLSRVPDPQKYRLLDVSKRRAAFNAHRESGQRRSTQRIVTATDELERYVSIAEVLPSNISPAPRGHLVVGIGKTVEAAYARWRQKNWVALSIWCVMALTIFGLAWLVARRQAQLTQEIANRETSTIAVDSMTQELIQINQALDEHAIVSATDTTGKIIFANDKFCRISGYKRQELLGQDHSIVNSGTHSKEFFREMWQTIAGGQPWHGLVCNRAKAGRLYWVNSTIIPIFNRQGVVDRYISIRTDVTAMVLAEDAAERANLAKSTFLSNMSHELRTPLNAIIGFGQLLETNDLDPDSRENVAHIQKAGHHLLTLINEILDLAKVESGKIELSMEVIDIDQLLQDSIELIRPVITKHEIELQYEPANEKLSVVADRNRLGQAVLNLLSNAIKYNRPQGKVRIYAEARPNHRVHINICDTGIGISPADLQNLFTPFSRFGPKHLEGTGIGLTLTKRLIELMQGTLGVASESGVGSTFWIELDAASSGMDSPLDEKQAPQSAASSDTTAIRSATILYIEDQAANLLFVQKVLQKKRPQFKLLQAAEPYLGLNLARAQRPDLILLDINLPEIDGYEVLRRLRADPETRNIPVIAISANAMTDDLIKGKAACFADYLTKPVDIPALLAAIDLSLAQGTI